MIHERRLPELFFERVMPTGFATSHLVSFNPSAAALIDLDPHFVDGRTRETRWLRGISEASGQRQDEACGSTEPVGLDGIVAVGGLMKVRMGSCRDHRHRGNAGFGKRHMISPGKEPIEFDGLG